mmetsp:Transcript_102249/g.292656  ORF Transcript_102249/g.292656 Transcript_102249/m.292656 type:complete len:499 (+) Transcript_102249:615-2111(+)
MGRGELGPFRSLPAAEQEEVGEMIAMFTEAAAQGHKMAQARLADFYLNPTGDGPVAQDQARALELYTQAGLQGFDRAQYMAGFCHHQGKGCEQSFERAAEWYIQAAEQGLGFAESALAVFYLNGQGVPQNDERAVHFMKLSSAKGNANATRGLSSLHNRGANGVAHSIAEARRLLELAIERANEPRQRDSFDFASATEELGRVNDKIQRFCPLLGRRVVLRRLTKEALNGARGKAIDYGMTKRLPHGGWDIQSARYTVKLDGSEGKLVRVTEEHLEVPTKKATSAELNKMFMDAMCLIGPITASHCRTNQGEWYRANLPAEARKQVDEGLSMLTKAADQGHLGSQSELADFYYDGDTVVAQDYTRALELYTAAADHGAGAETSMINVGEMYKLGQGCDQSYERAAEWFAKAEALNFHQGQYAMARCFLKGQGRPVDEARAVELLKLSVAQRYPPAMVLLSDCSLKGLGMPPSYAETRRLLMQALRINGTDKRGKLGSG